jgi:hypothetical protein
LPDLDIIRAYIGFREESAFGVDKALAMGKKLYHIAHQFFQKLILYLSLFPSRTLTNLFCPPYESWTVRKSLNCRSTNSPDATGSYAGIR